MAYQDLNPEDYRERIESNKDFVRLDVRTPQEFEEGHIPGAINIDVQDVSFRHEIDKLDKTKSYFVNCRSGGRSAVACKIMSEYDFQGELYNLEGGMLAWRDRGFEVER